MSKHKVIHKTKLSNQGQDRRNLKKPLQLDVKLEVVSKEKCARQVNYLLENMSEIPIVSKKSKLGNRTYFFEFIVISNLILSKTYVIRI